MLKFSEYFLSESKSDKEEKSGSAINTHMARVYERATALLLHDHTGAKHNKDKNYQAKIKALKAEHLKDMEGLPPKVLNAAIEAAHRSSNAYMESLKNNHGIDLNKIHEVHHTGTETLGDKDQNPHDVIIKYRDGNKEKMHGASLKKTQGTLSNNTTKSFAEKNRENGIGQNIPAIWEKGRKKVGFSGKSVKETKPRRTEEGVVSQYKKTQIESAKHHADSFNAATHDKKKNSLLTTMKLNYNRAVPYDYVSAEKGKATPVEDMAHAKALHAAKSLHATQSGNLVHIHDDKGQHLLTYEHRSTHGPFHSDQVNAKLGTLKSKQESAPLVKKAREKLPSSGEFGGMKF